MLQNDSAKLILKCKDSSIVENALIDQKRKIHITVPNEKRAFILIILKLGKCDNPYLVKWLNNKSLRCHKVS